MLNDEQILQKTANIWINFSDENHINYKINILVYEVIFKILEEFNKTLK